MPLVQTRGAASAQGFGEFAQASVPNYIEEVFSTYLYTGNGSTQTITNGIDLAGKGGLVWQKTRSIGTTNNVLCDTARGVNAFLFSNDTLPSINNGGTDAVYSYNANGFSTGTVNSGDINLSGETAVSWTFREQPKFFDVVTYTGNGTAGRTVAHNLGSVPGFMIVKNTSSTTNWFCWHRTMPNTDVLRLNSTIAQYNDTTAWNSTTPTSTVFTVGTSIATNNSGDTYVAYLFAHDAGGFGLTGTDNVISCGTFATDGSGNATVSLGYEPQWALVKRTDAAGTWWMMDTMRGWTASTGNNFQYLQAQSSSAEGAAGTVPVNATGFTVAGNNFSASATYIYIACRRGPMKVPTLGTSVFQPVTYSGNGSNDRLVDTTITPDLFIDMRRDNVMNKYVLDRLRGNGRLYSDLTNAESANTAQVPANTFNVNQTGVTVSADELNTSGRTYVLEAFRRAPGFFDEVCYTGTGSATTQTHNLGVAPELLIIKDRTNAQVAGGWNTWTTGFVIGASNNEYVALNTTNAKQDKNSSEFWNSSYPTASVFGIGNSIFVNESGSKYVAYLFATCAGVSKVGSYTGTATTKQIDCGFTGGARFVLIKRTDSTGDWYVWDSARGIVAGNDPYLLLNSTAAEVTSTDYVDTYSAGFEISSTAPAAINASGGSFIFLAIA